MKNRFFLACLASISAAAAQAQTVAIQGTVYTVSGEPIAGATCQFKNVANKVVTDAKGKYAFNGPVSLRGPQGYAISMQAQGRQIALRLDREETIGLDLFDLSGKAVRAITSGKLAAGTHSLALALPQTSQQLYLLRVRLGSEIAWHKLTLQSGMVSLASTPTSPSGVLAKTTAAAATDSLFCTSPDHNGGLAKINGRAVNAYTGTYDIRMFSTNPAWKTQCAMPMTFNFDNSPGVAKYKGLIPDWIATEQEILVEVCQATFKLPTQPKKYATYVANIKLNDGVANTGGNTLNFNSGYINGLENNYKGWLEILGVQTHEATHSYQAYYTTTGAAGFGEAMPDAVRALNGYFSWPKGTRCGGGFEAYYQGGGKYWYYIEMKHPGFLTTVWQQPQGTIASRVQSITGESLASLAAECESKGMP
jgi:hypothetical protein